MKQLFNYILGLVKKPDSTFQTILEKRPWIQGILILILAEISYVLYSCLFEKFFGLRILLTQSPVRIIPTWLIFSIIVYFVSKPLKGKGSLSDTLLLLAFANTPVIFTILLAIPLFMKKLSFFMLIIIGLLLLLWSIHLYIMAIKRAQQLTTARASSIFIGIIILSWLVESIIKSVVWQDIFKTPH